MHMTNPGDTHPHHHHESHHHENVFPLLEISTHQKAVIGTIRCRIPKDYETGIENLKKTLTDIAREIEDLGGIIGHLKAFVREEDRSCMLSVTEADDIQSKEGRADALYVEIADIAFGISETQMEDILKKYFADHLKNCR